MGPLALLGIGGDILGGLTKMAGGIAGAAGDTKTAGILNQVGGGISGVSNMLGGGILGMLSKGGF